MPVADSLIPSVINQIPHRPGKRKFGHLPFQHVILLMGNIYGCLLHFLSRNCVCPIEPNDDCSIILMYINTLDVFVILV